MKNVLEQQIAGRMMAIDRASLPALATRATMRAGGIGLEQLAELRAGMMGGRDVAGLAVKRMGAVAVIPLVGLITSDPILAWLVGGTSPDALAAAVRDAVADPQVGSIVLLVDSPGGECSLIMETAAVLRQARAQKPITAIARTMMASAAYWLSAQATTVVATPSAYVGSVGVFLTHVDESVLDEKLGVHVIYIASDPKKVEGNPDYPLGDDTRAFWQSQVDITYGKFIADLALGRRATEASVRAGFGQGRAFGADEARSRRMVDRIDTLEGVLGSAMSGKRPTSYAAVAAGADQAAIEAEHLMIVAALAR
jgi:signal peptide peptidase SppA